MAIPTNKKLCFITSWLFVVFGLGVVFQISFMNKKLPFSQKPNLVLKRINEVNETKTSSDTSSKSEIEKVSFVFTELC